MPPHVAPSAPSFDALDDDDDDVAGAAEVVAAAGADEVAVAGADETAGAVVDAFVGVVAVVWSLPPPHAPRTTLAENAPTFRIIMAARLA